ncbi:MAG TPA: hypothetical protein VHL53_03700 [Acidimicrobiia bacterium]|nr:hypothetical protein [Acidimicrobiia bacterium]
MRPSTLLATVVGFAALGAACGSGGSGRPPVVVALAGQTVATAKLETIAGGVCRAAGEAATSVDTARNTFFGVSHDGLHLIARGLQDDKQIDASAALLEAKQKVEADFLDPPPAGRLEADLRALAAVTRSGLAHFKVPADPCTPP